MTLFLRTFLWKTLLKWLFLSVLLTFSSISYSDHVEEDPSALNMLADLLIARPLLVTTTVAGSALFVVSLPVTIPGGNVKQTEW